MLEVRGGGTSPERRLTEEEKERERGGTKRIEIKEDIHRHTDK